MRGSDAAGTGTTPPARVRKLGWGRGVLLLGLVVFVAAGLSRISFNIDILRLLPTHLPQVEGLSLFLKNFAQSNELIVTVEAGDADSAAAAVEAIAEELRGRPDLVKRAVSRPPWESNPADLAEFLAFLLLNQDPEKIQALVARLSPTQASATLQATLEKLNDSVSPQEIALRSYDPFDLAAPLAESGLISGAPQSEFSSADGAFRVLYVESARPFAHYQETMAWVREVQRLARLAAAPHGAQLGFTGEPAFVADISGSMEWDMKSSGIVTLLVISSIFWFCYRRARPLLELQAMLLLIFVISLAAAGLLLEQLTVIGVGFASIMIGLSVDYGYFVYQRSRHHTGAVRQLQRQCLQNIIWTSSTTAAAFFALNLSSLPGLSQLGNLVGIGVIVGAVVMLGVFAPLAHRLHQGQPPPSLSVSERASASPAFFRFGAICTLILVAVLLGGLIFKGMRPVDFSARTMRPRVSEAYTALDRLYSRLTDDRNLINLLVRGPSERETLARLRIAEAQLARAKETGHVATFRSSSPLWPDADRQASNLPVLAPLAAALPRLRASLLAEGFTAEAFALTESVLNQWASWARQAPPIWPDNEMSHWIFRRTASRQPGQFIALGLVEPTAGRDDALASAVRGEGIYLVSWGLLGQELKRVIPREFAHVILGLAALVLLLLAVAFRSARVVGLFAATTALVLACLAGAMSLLGMSWSFFNLAAILLLLGTGTDYSILLLLALKRHGGNPLAAQRELALVIALCSSSAAAGFGTLSWANNQGLAALGQTCALGLLIDALISLFLMPPAWSLLHPKR